MTDDDDDEGPPRLPGGKFYMTPQGHQRLLDEFRQLRSGERPRVVDIVAWAASNGDRSENADYKEGKRRLREIDRRLRFLDRRLRHAEVVDPSAQANRAQVFFGATVSYANQRDEAVTVTIVGVDEADMTQGKVSIGSPVALALLRARKGDEVTVRTPRGPELIEVLDISYPDQAPPRRPVADAAGVAEDARHPFRETGTMTDAKLAPNLPGWMQEHANRYLTSGGAEGHMYRMAQPGRPEIMVPSLLLTTIGRKSGEKYIFPLFYGTTGDSYFVIASKGGAPEHPGWYRNILANPQVEVQVGTKQLKARARTATGEERARLWEKSLEFWPPYAEYQQKTEREIPVVVLDPVT